MKKSSIRSLSTRGAPLVKVALCSAILSVNAFGRAPETSAGNPEAHAAQAAPAAGAPALPSAKHDRLISIVVLLSAPRPLDERVLGKAVSEALGVKRSNDSSDESFVKAKPPYYRVQLESGAYVLNNLDKIYCEDGGKLVENIKDPELQKTVASHKAWLSIDWAGKEEPEDLLIAYQNMGKIVAALAGPDVLALYSPEIDQFSPWNETVQKSLSGEDPLEVFGGAAEVGAAVPMRDDDPLLQAAEAEARKRWPEFVQAYESKSGQAFAVKGRIVEGKNVEYLWLAVSSLEKDLVHGKLDNRPLGLTTLRMGQDLHIQVSDVDDWVYLDAEKRPVGGFTGAVLDQASTRAAVK